MEQLDVLVNDKPKKSKKSVESVPVVTPDWEPKVGQIVVYWMKLGSQTHGYPAIITNKSFGRDNQWDLVRFQPVNFNASVPVFNVEFSESADEGKFTKPE